MLGWLDRFWTGVSGSVGTVISRAVHYAIHALASVVFGVFHAVGDAWHGLYVAMAGLHKALDEFGLAVFVKLAHILTDVIPHLIRWAESRLAMLARALSVLYHQLLADVRALIDRIGAAVTAALRWVEQHVYLPLKAFADQIWNDLKKWGYTAWWYITHPESLAELLVMPLADSLERHAWAIARKLGTFIVALISANIERIAILAEDIITGVF